MPSFLIASGAGDERARYLATLVGGLGQPATLLPDLDGLHLRPDYIAARRPLVLLPDLAGDARALDSAIRFAEAAAHPAAEGQGAAGHPFLLYVADTIAPEAYKRLVRTAAADWTTWEGAPAELREVVRRLAEPDAAERSGKVVSFVPSKGGVGNTTLAIETAVDLAARSKRSGARIAILDLNFAGGTLADALDLEPRFDIREIIGRPERLDEQLIDIFTSRHSPRLDIFASPIRRVRVDEVDPAIVFGFLDAIAGRYEVVVLDIPTGWLPWIDNVLQGSDTIVLSGGSTVPAVKQMVARLAQLDGIAIAPDKVAVAVNGCDADLFGRIARRAEIDRSLAGRRVFYVRRDAAAVDGALDVGRPLTETSPNSRAARDIAKLARWADPREDRADTPARSRAKSPAKSRLRRGAS